MKRMRIRYYYTKLLTLCLVCMLLLFALQSALFYRYFSVSSWSFRQRSRRRSRTDTARPSLSH